jgi:hypothetical protein
MKSKYWKPSSIDPRIDTFRGQQREIIAAHFSATKETQHPTSPPRFAQMERQQARQFAKFVTRRDNK